MANNLNRVTAIPIPEVKPINSTLSRQNESITPAVTPTVSVLTLVNPSVRNNLVPPENKVQANVKAVAAGIKAFNVGPVGTSVMAVRSPIGLAESAISGKVLGALGLGSALGGVGLVSPLTSLFNQQLIDLQKQETRALQELKKLTGLSFGEKPDTLNHKDSIPVEGATKVQLPNYTVKGLKTIVEKKSELKAFNLNRIDKKLQEEKAQQIPINRAAGHTVDKVNSYLGDVHVRVGIRTPRGAHFLRKLELLRRYRFLVADSSPDNFTVVDDKISGDDVVGLFATCASPSYEFNLETIKEGTWEFPRKIMSSVNTGDIVLKKGMFKTQTSLWRWITSAIRGRITRRDITIYTLMKPPIFMDSGINLSVAKYTLFNCLPAGYNHEGWDAFSPDVQLYSLAISYEYFEEEEGSIRVTPNNIVESKMELVQ